MKITLGGKPGAGKSAIARILAERFSLKQYSVGDVMRELASKEGMKVEEFVRTIDVAAERAVDERTREIGRTQDNFVFDGRLAFYFIPDSIKIFLDVDSHEGARRIFTDPRASEKPAASAEELAARNEERWEIDVVRYRERYGVEMGDARQYDLVINTTQLSREEVCAQIEAKIRDFAQNIDKNSHAQ